MGAMVEAARGTALSVHSIRDIGPDYAITLRAWRSAWEKYHKEVGGWADTGYQHVFRGRLHAEHCLQAKVGVALATFLV
jgi:cyclopropane fatty-acyl-phospholipid synthase-like methyltransferase